MSTIDQETLNHLFSNATALAFSAYPPDGLHIAFDNGATLTIYADDGVLDISLLGPPVAESPNMERQVEVEG